MKPIPSEFERCLRSSRDRSRVFLTLASLGESYVGHLARHTGIRPDRVRAVLVGGRYYSEERSLAAMGAVEVVQTPHGRVFRITPQGRRKARSIVASRARRAALESARERATDALTFPGSLRPGGREGDRSAGRRL